MPNLDLRLRILAGVDWPFEDDVVLYGAALAAALGAELTIAHVHTGGRRPEGLELPEAAKLASVAGVTAHTRVLSDEDAALGLARHADHEDYDLMVVGRGRQRDLISSVRFGVSSRVAQVADTPVVLVPVSDEQQTATRKIVPVLRSLRVLMPLGGPKLPEGALELLTVLAIPLGASITLFHAAYSPTSAGHTARLVEKASAWMPSLQAELVRRGLHTWFIVAAGEPREAILRPAEGGEFDLLFMCGRKTVSPDILVTESVSEYVAHDAPIPVLLYRIPARPAAKVKARVQRWADLAMG